MATTKLEDATEERKRAKDRLAAAKAEIDVAKNALTPPPPLVPPPTPPVAVGIDAARNPQAPLALRLALATDALVSSEKRAAEIRRKLSIVPTPADGQALLAELERVTVDSHIAQSLVLNYKIVLEEAEARFKRAVEAAAAAAAALAHAEEALSVATKAADAQTKLTDKVKAPPLASVQTDAVALKAGTLYAAARDRLRKDLTDSLFTRAKERRTLEKARLADAAAVSKAARDTFLTKRSDLGAAARLLAKPAEDLEHAESALKLFAASSLDFLALAETSLKKVGDPEIAKLTDEQRACIQGDAALNKSRDDALKAEAARDKTLIALSAAEAAWRQAEIKALADDTDASRTAADTKKNDYNDARQAADDSEKVWHPSGEKLKELLKTREDRKKELDDAKQKVVPPADPSVDPDVIKASDAFDKAQKDYNEAQLHYILHAWSAAVPDATWRLFEEFERADDLLTDLAAIDPAKLITAVDTAEKNYIAVLASANQLTQNTTALEEYTLLRQAAATHRTEKSSDFLFSALRGDR